MILKPKQFPSESLERKLDLARRSIKVNASKYIQIECWKSVQTQSLEENNEEWFDQSTEILKLLGE